MNSFLLRGSKSPMAAGSRAVGRFGRPPALTLRRLLLLVAVVLIVALTAMKLLSIAGGRMAIIMLMVSVVDWVRGLGVMAVPMLFAIESLCFVLLMPIWPLHVGIGFLWGVGSGLLLAWSAYAVGCVPPFLLARLPCLAERFTALRRRADLLDGIFSAVETEPFKLIVCIRMSPLIPSTLNSYLLGLTAVPLRTYVGASLIGALPNVGAYVYLGSLLESLADIAAGRVQRSPLSLALLITGLAATVGVLVYVSRVATKRVQAASRRSSDTLEAGDTDEDNSRL